jgi:hypothetical protein
MAHIRPAPISPSCPPHAAPYLAETILAPKAILDRISADHLQLELCRRGTTRSMNLLFVVLLHGACTHGPSSFSPRAARARPRPLRQAPLLDARSAQRLLNGFFGTQQKSQVQLDAQVRAKSCRAAPTVLILPAPGPHHPHNQRAQRRAHKDAHTRAQDGYASWPPKLARHGTTCAVCYALLAPRIFATRAATSALQAASMLERMTFDEGGAWLPQRL